MIYTVDRGRIHRQFLCLDDCVEVLICLQGASMDLRTRFSLARALHISIEAMIDVGSVLIDGFIMRDPGGYIDIIEILENEQVIPLRLAVEIKKVVGMREHLVRRYDELNEEEMVPFIYKTHLFVEFKESIMKYLQKELV